MEIIKTEYNYQLSKNRPYSLDTPADVEGIVIIKSACSILFNGENCAILPDCILLIPKNSHTEFLPSECEITIDILLFKGNIIEKAHTISNMPCHEISEIIQKIKTEYLEDRFENGEICSLYGDIVMHKLNRLMEEKKQMHKRHAFFKIREDIYHRPYNNKKVEDLVKESGLSRRQFYYTWKVIFNKTPLQDITESKLEYAKMLLTTTEMRIGEITAACGYGSDQYFVQSFKKSVGVTPSQFRYEFTRWNEKTPKI